MAPSKQDLVLDGDIGSCLDLLWRNRKATSVVIDNRKRGISQDDCLTLFRSLANNPRIRRLRVRNLKNPLPAKALSVVINDPGSRLRHLHLERVTLTGKIGDYMVLIESLRFCTLQSIHMYYCEFDDKKLSLDPLVRGMATIATLEHVSLAGTKLAPEGRKWTPGCLQQLLPQLRSLTLKDIPNFRHRQLCALLSALEHPTCALRELTLQKQNLSEKSIVRIAQMLQKNTSLQELTLDVASADNVVVIARALNEKRHRSLLRLSFPGEWGQQHLDFYSEARQVLLNMVQTNTQLSRVSLGDDKNSLSAEMAKYVNMNLAYRRPMFGSASSLGQRGAFKL